MIDSVKECTERMLDWDMESKAVCGVCDETADHSERAIHQAVADEDLLADGALEHLRVWNLRERHLHAV